MRTEHDATHNMTCYRTLVPVASADGSAPWHSPQACIGSVCSAWRWGPEDWRKTRTADDVLARKEPPRPADVPASWTWTGYDDDPDYPPHWTEPQEEADRRRKGYCGAAGPWS